MSGLVFVLALLIFLGHSLQKHRLMTESGLHTLMRYAVIWVLVAVATLIPTLIAATVGPMPLLVLAGLAAAALALRSLVWLYSGTV
jgi:hypothetical protein